jgi:hypothetical protein
MMGKNTRNAAGWFLLQLLLATLLIGCTFEDNIEALRREKLKSETANKVVGDSPLTPVAADFDISGLSQVYDGSPKQVSIMPKSGMSGGLITIYYEGMESTAYTASTTAPSALGAYSVTFDVAEATGWEAVSGLSAGTLTINVLPTFSSIADFKTWLDAQPPNGEDAPYFVALNLRSLRGDYNTAGSLGNLLRTTYSKYVSLDLSGSTFISIGDLAFYGCHSLAGVSIPNSVTSIGDRAFGSSNLASVTIGDSVTSIGEGAFMECYSLLAINVDAANTAYSSVDGVLYNKDKTILVVYPASKTNASFTIPSGVTTIGWMAFFYCTSLASVTIPDSVTSIGDRAFYECTSLAAITIPDSVTSIEDGAFYGCLSLAAIEVAGSNTEYSSVDGVLYNKTQTELLQYPAGKTNASFTIPSGITKIVRYLTFHGCSSLTSVTIPDSVTSIGINAFGWCGSLASIIFEGTIPSNSFERYAFYDLGDLRDKFYATDPANGTPGTYTTTAPVGISSVWQRTN